MRKKIINIALILTLSTSTASAADIDLSFTNSDANNARTSNIEGSDSDNVTITHNVTNSNIPVNVSAISTNSGTLSITNTSGEIQADTISTSSGLVEITNAAAGTITGNIDISSAASASFLSNSGTVAGNVILGDSTSVILNDLSSITGTITGSTNGDGIVEIVSNSTYVTQSNIGSTSNKVNLIQILPGATLNAATNNNAIFVNSAVVISSGSFLTLGTGSVTGVIGGENNGDGTVNINDNNTLAGSLGTSSNSLSSVVIAANKTLTAGSNNIDAANITLESNSILSVGSGSVTGKIDGSSSEDGTVAFTADHTISSGSEIGEATAIGEVTIADGVTLTANTDVIATTTTVGGGTSGALILGNSTSYTSNINIGDSASVTAGSSTTILGTATLSTGSTLTLNDATATTIATDTDGEGDLIISGSSGVSTSDIGSSSLALNSITISDSGFFNVSNNNNAIFAESVSIGNSAILRLGTGSVTGEVTGSSDEKGQVQFFENNTLAGNMGTSSNSLALVLMTANKTLTAGSNNIDAANITLESNSILSVGSGSVTGAIDGSSAEDGTVAYTASNATGGNIGSTKSIAAITIADGATLSANHNITATTVTVGGGTSGALNLAASKTITGAVTLDNNATLQLSDSSSVTGVITGSSNKQGIIKITADSSYTSSSNIGSSSNKIATLTVASGSTLNTATNSNSIFAGAINLGSGSTFTVGGSITGDITLSGGTINFGSTSRAITGDLTGGGNSIFTLESATHTVSGATTFASGDTININIADASTAGRITTTGILTAPSGLNLNIVTSISSISSSAQDYTILSGSSSSSINKIADDNINLNGSGSNFDSNLSYSTLVSSNSLILRVTKTTVETPSFLGDSTTPLGKTFSIAANIENAQGELATIKSYLTSNSGNQKLVKDAVKSITPNDVGVSQNTRSTISSSITNIQTRLTSTRNSPAPSGFKTVNIHGQEIEANNHKQYASAKTRASDANYLSHLKNKSVWGQLITNRAKQDAKNGSSGYDSKLFGFSFGADTKISDSLTIGISTTIANSKIDSSDNSKTTEVDSYQLIGYSEKKLNDKIYLSGFIGTSFNQYSSRRFISLVNKTADANYNGQSFFARLGASYIHKENDLTISPQLATNLTYDTIDDYTESGAGTANLNVKNKNYSIIELEPSISISKTYKAQDKFIEPSIALAYGYNFANNPKASSANFIGQTSTFQNQAAKIERGTIRLNAGLSFYQEEEFTASVNYTLEKRSSFTSKGALVKFDWKF